jgi:poly(hydroxyalkanoate) depolymerase family esterase
MRSISDTIARLSKLSGGLPTSSSGPGRLQTFTDFGSDPGGLAARSYIPETLASGAPLVVVLHGCTQTAADYDHGAGWSTLADRHGFALLFPEQRRMNNANLCFNWFEPGDIRRGQGEALSISQMIRTLCEAHGLDRSRVYVTGLSAGGAMTAVMLATYPELFAGGAIIAGLPYGCASNVPEAFDRMRGHGGPGDEALATLVTRASMHDGPRPSLSIWHGTADTTVVPSNVDRIVGQWRRPLRVGAEPDRIETVAGHRHSVWSRPDGTVAIETFLISGMGHGVPIDRKSCGTAGAYMFDVGLSSTEWLVRSWGLASAAGDARQAGEKNDRRTAMRLAPRDAPVADAPVVSTVTTVIENALRAAGLMR